MSLLDNASLLLTPNAVKASKLYSVIPSNGNGDFTATRATTATRINPSGLVESVALNVPRLDYSLGGCPNILLEPQRTNLALQSSSFDNATWAKAFTIVTANTATSPSGIQDADTLAGDGQNNRHDILQTSVATLTSGVTYTTSIYAKKNTNNFIQIVGGGTPYAANTFANFDLNNGTLGSTGGGATSTITSVGNGWYRCTMTAVAINTTTVNTFIIALITSATSVRSEVSTLSTSVFLWGAQLEAGTYATSYIPTTTASVTRNADSITRNNIYTNGLITAAGGTWFVELRNNRALSRDVFSNGIFFSGSSGSLQIRNTSGGRLAILKIVGGTSTTLYTTISDTSKIAIKWNGSTADVFVNGVKQVAATAFTETALQTLDCLAADVPKYINEMALFPTPLTDAQCLALTA